MVEYPTDLQLTDDLDIRLDQSNDLATQGGIRQLEQSLALDALEITIDFVGEQLNGTQLGLLESQVEQAINEDEQIADVRSIDIESFDPNIGRVEIAIQTTQNENFTIEADV